MSLKAHILPALLLVLLATTRQWAWAAAAFGGTVAADGFMLWFHPYGKCGSPFHRGGQNLGSAEEAWGRCPKCKGQPVVRHGARAVAALMGAKHGKRYW